MEKTTINGLFKRYLDDLFYYLQEKTEQEQQDALKYLELKLKNTRKEE